LLAHALDRNAFARIKFSGGSTRYANFGMRIAESFSRRNFANLAVFPTDHRQSSLAKFDTFLARGAAMGLGCNASLR